MYRIRRDGGSEQGKDGRTEGEGAREGPREGAGDTDVFAFTNN